MNGVRVRRAIARSLTGLMAACVAGMAAAAPEHCPGGPAVPTAQSAAKSADPALLRDVPSPDWREQIIYLAMIDRFADGDRCNDDQHAGEFASTDERRFNGGDIQGLRDRLDYIQAIGATTLWVTPPVANQWWDPQVGYGGYHGYWARDFSRIDEHFGTLADYQGLASDLHRRGMYLMQDIVVNHTGNFFGYDPAVYDPRDPSIGFRTNDRATPTARPTQHPFDLDDPRRAKDRASAIYHWTPDIADVGIRNQELTYQSSGLDDINTANPIIRDVFKSTYGKWITDVGVDAFRIDTVRYVEPEFYADFLHGKGGIDATAASTGRHDFLTIAEINLTSQPGTASAERRMLPYLDDAAHPAIGAPIGYPLYKDLLRVMSGGAPTADLSFRLKAQMESFPHPYLTANFVDNHDVERFLLHGTEAGFVLAYAVIMTVPGIPMIYQGDEQGFSITRQAMFAGGYASNRDHYDTAAPLFHQIQALARMRRANPVLSRGRLSFVADNRSGSGVLAYGRSLEGQQAYIVFNTADHPALLNGAALRFAHPDRTAVAFQYGYPQPFRTGPRMIGTRVLPPKSVIVLLGDEPVSGVDDAARPGSARVSIANLRAAYVDVEHAAVAGTVSVGGSRLLRVIDGDLAGAKSFRARADGSWSVDLPVDTLGARTRTLEIYAPDLGVASPQREYRISGSVAQQAAAIDDPAGDDHGPRGDYREPRDPSFGCQMDIRGMSARARGPILEVTIRMCALTSIWEAPFGFDHVSFGVFLTVPALGSGGATALPGLHASLPRGGRWQIANEVQGWGTVAYRAEGSSADQIGRAFEYAPLPKVDRAARTLTITYDGERLGVGDWAGTSIYLTTWDRDGTTGQYRRLSASGGPWDFGGGAAGDPLVIDDATLTLRPVGNKGPLALQ